MSNSSDMIEKALKETGLPYEIQRGRKHKHIRLAGKFVGIVPYGRMGDAESRSAKNVRAQIRRAAKEVRAERHAQEPDTNTSLHLEVTPLSVSSGQTQEDSMTVTSPFAPLAEVKFDAPPQPAKRKPAQYATTDLAKLDELLDTFNITEPAAAPKIGYSRAAITHWREKGEMPMSASMACELLLERHAAVQPEDAIVVARIPADKQTVILTLLESMGVTYTQV